MDKDAILDQIFNDDPLGLLNVKAKQSNARTPDERLSSSFQEINDFIEKNGKEPKANVSSVSEFQLYARLKNLREDPLKVEMLKDFDVNNVLPESDGDQVKEPSASYGGKVEVKVIESIEDIFNDDSLDLLGGDDSDLFKFDHTPKETTMPGYVARRKPCKNFADFEKKFQQCQVEITSGKRLLTPFRNEQEIDKGYFFVLKGVLVYVAAIAERKADVKGKINARLRCIFENGTESDMLLRSLSAELYKDGRRVTAHEDHQLDNFNNITEEDEEVGFVYVLKSKSENEEIRSIQNLYKIGYSRTDVLERIKNAEKQPTYLMAAVDYVAGWKCYNMNPQKFEQLIHNFFGSSCLEVDVFDANGKRHTPREWFIAPIHVIEQVVELIINGKVIEYKYDAETMSIIGR